MKTKKTAIKEAYGEMWDKLSTQQQNYALENNGTIFFEPSEENGTPKLLRDLWGYFKMKGDKLDDQDYGNSFTSYHTPISLRGIEDNNGWIKLISTEDLPKKNGMYHTRYSDGTISSRFYHNKYNDWSNDPKATHYQLIEKPKPPVY